jgi:acyl-CoA reductase-like NAD-dependent aldehyde dehydrogenase
MVWVQDFGHEMHINLSGSKSYSGWTHGSIPFLSSWCTFGGYKQSGIGRENHKMMLVIPSDKKYANFHTIKEIRFLVEDYSD